MKLSEDQTLQFVKLYKRHECLYDTSHPHYKFRHAREAAMREMIQEFGIPGIRVDDVKKKIKSLRSTYFLEMEKIQKYKNMGTNYKSKLKWYNEMSTVLEKHSRRSTGVHEDTSALEYDIEIDPSTSEDMTDMDPLNTLKDTQIKEERAEQIRIPKKTNVATLLRDLKKELRNSNDVRNMNNEFDIYGRYVAASLKKLSCQQAIYAQNQINNILTTAKMQDLLCTQTMKSVSESGDNVEEYLDTD
ncbi:uncharacterized protein LOC106138615 [Amyelois transitella]|uniref:uncharacterized protein LOC106138615 n=1 Tax=Amyelois transitella TaxID=680683 RepID=UPI00298FC50F|nr:uncharacterized protein LOC106138615 [Amyelois transitella]